MAIKADQSAVSIDVQLQYDSKGAQKIAQQVASFQRKQTQTTEKHKTKLRQQNETHIQKLKQMDDRADKKAQIRAKAHQKKLLTSTKSWSSKMVSSINGIKTAVLVMGAAFISAQVIGGIKQLATESLSLASDMNTLAKAVGLEVEELSKLRGVALVTGVSFGTLESSFGAINKRLEEARNGSITAQKAFAALDIDIDTASLQDVIKASINAAKNSDNLGKIADVTGTRASTAFAKMATHADNFDASMVKAGKTFGELETDGAEALNSLSDKLAQMRLKLSYSITNALSTATPELEKLLSKIATGLEAVDWVTMINALKEIAKFTALLTKTFVKLAPAIVGVKAAAASMYGAFKLTTAISAKAAYDALTLEKNLKGATTAIKGVTAVSVKMADASAKTTKATKTAADAIGKMTKITASLSKIINSVPAGLRTFGRAIGKVSGYLTAFFVVWDLFKAKASGLGWLQSAGYAIASFAGDIGSLVGLPQLTNRLDKWLVDTKKSVDEAEAYIAKKRESMLAIQVRLGPQIDPELLAQRNKDVAATTKQRELNQELISKLVKLRDTTKANSVELAYWTAQLDKGSISLEEFTDLTVSLKKAQDTPTPDSNLTTAFAKYTEAVKKYIQDLKDAWTSATNAAEKYIDAQRTLDNVASLSLQTREQLTSLLAAQEERRLALLMQIENMQGGAGTTAEIARLQKLIEQYEALRAAMGETTEALSGKTKKVSWEEYFDTDGLAKVGAMVGSIADVFGSLVQAEQYRLDAQREARQEQIDGINDELDTLNRLGFANTMWARRKEKEAEELAKSDEKRLRKLQKRQQKLAAGAAIINAFGAMAKNLATYALPLGAILGGIALAQGLAQAKAISAQKFHTGGVIQGNPYQDSTQVLAEGGEYIVNQSATEKNKNLLESINNGATLGGGGGITININGNVLGEDRWVRDNLIPEISRALEEGHTLNAYA